MKSSVIGINMQSKGKMNSLVKEPELRNLKGLFFVYAFLIIAGIVMPQYFGIHIGYDITCSRFANLLIIIYMVCSPKIFTHFCKVTAQCAIFWPAALYLCVAGYTMVFRVDINAFFLVFLEMLTLFMLIYGIRYVVGYKRAIKWVIYCAYFLSVYGFIEYACDQSLFLKFFKTMATAVGNSYRSGHYRIMGPCGHALAYGLVLILFIAFACLDEERNEINLLKRPVLLFMLFCNVFLTGSRSTLGIAVLEMIIILLFSKRKNIKKSLLGVLGLITVLAVFLLLFHQSSMGRYILGQVTSVVDQFLGTEYAAQFGVSTETLQNSSEYREVLPEIFKLDWLNPIVGRGAKGFGGAEINGIYIHSIDNYYVLQYIKYAYPGMISYILFMIVLLCVLIRDIIESKSALSKIVLIGGFCYFFNLWWVDALQTLKYMNIAIAIFYACRLERKDLLRRQTQK
ncbi:MAG: hypothetical protein E7261_02285 [Lachnospiraceae bacterium]|nr:hypothetical protein [Lachnospiraceae bacterium]